MTETTHLNPMRPAGFWEKVICRLRSPLASLPETRNLTSVFESARYGYDALGFRFIAESLIMGVQYVVGSAVEGDIAEFGTQTGRTAKVISMAMKLYRADKTFHMFDSFEGMPEAHAAVDKDNAHVKLGVWSKGQLKGISPQDLQKACSKFIRPEAIKIYKGWFSDSLPKIPQGTRFCMVHVDSDLYSSAFETLDHLFKTKAISEGAIIFFDDWNCHKSSNLHGERKAWEEIVGLYNVSSEDMGGYGWGARRFVVHSYSPRRV